MARRHIAYWLNQSQYVSAVSPRNVCVALSEQWRVSTQIAILSIGTGDSLFSTASRRNAGLSGWILPDGAAPPLVFQAAVKAQSHNALGQAGLLVGRNNLMRIDPFEGRFPIGLDETGRAILELPEAARSHAEASGHRVFELFLADAIEPYVKCPAA